MKFEEMTVRMLRAEMKKRKLPQEHNGKKFTKKELIEKLNDYEFCKNRDDRNENDVVKNDELKQPDPSPIDEEAWETPTPVEDEVKNDYISFAKTLDEIKQKYLKQKKADIYDRELVVDSTVVFIHVVIAKNGNTYEKLRTAKVIGVNRTKKLVKVKMFYGEEMLLRFDELIYIKGIGENATYPNDIATFIRNQKQAYHNAKNSEVKRNGQNKRISTIKGNHFTSV